MPKASENVTELARKKTNQTERILTILQDESHKLFIRLTVSISLLLALGLVFGFRKYALAPATKDHVAIAALAGHPYELEIADTPALREQGLSHRPSLDSNQGMLFEFREPAKQCFWMKDMQFSLDILWFDAEKKLIYQQQNVAPSSFPHNFCSSSPALYVVEIKPRTVRLNLGDPLVLQKQ